MFSLKKGGRWETAGLRPAANSAEHRVHFYRAHWHDGVLRPPQSGWGESILSDVDSKIKGRFRDRPRLPNY